MASQNTAKVIPMRIPVRVCYAIQVDTILIASSVVWFAAIPFGILPLYCYAVEPVKLAVSFPLHPNPCTPLCDCVLTLHQGVDKVVFLVACDYGEVCSHTLANASSLALVLSRGIFDVITLVCKSTPTIWTTWKSTI